MSKAIGPPKTISNGREKFTNKAGTRATIGFLALAFDAVLMIGKAVSRCKGDG